MFFNVWIDFYFEQVSLVSITKFPFFKKPLLIFSQQIVEEIKGEIPIVFLMRHPTGAKERVEDII